MPDFSDGKPSNTHFYPQILPNPTHGGFFDPVVTSSVSLRPVTLFLPHDPNALFHSITVFFPVSSFFCATLSAQHSFLTLPRFPLSKSLNSPQHTANIRVSATRVSRPSLNSRTPQQASCSEPPLAPRPFNQTTTCLPTSDLNPSSSIPLPACGSCFPDQVQPSNLFQSPKLPPEFPDNRVPPAIVRVSATRVSRPSLNSRTQRPASTSEIDSESPLPPQIIDHLSQPSLDLQSSDQFLNVPQSDLSTPPPSDNQTFDLSVTSDFSSPSSIFTFTFLSPAWVSYIRDLILAGSGEVLPRSSSKRRSHLPPIPRKQKPVLAEFRSGLLDALEVHEREFAPLCAEVALRRQLGDSCGVQRAQAAVAACSDRNAQGIVDAMMESQLEEAALNAEVRMSQQVGSQRGYQQALQHFQKFDDLRKRAITLMETLEAMAEAASFVEERRMFQVPDGRLKRAGPVVDRLRMSHIPHFIFTAPSNGQLPPFPPSTPIPPPPSFMLRA